MFRSKLPDVGTTIFTVMSRRARELGALNLGQGFPDYPIDPRLTELVTEAMAQGFNQYAPMEGVIDLRQRIAQKLFGQLRADRGSRDADHGNAGGHRGDLRCHPGGGRSWRRGDRVRSGVRLL